MNNCATCEHKSRTPPGGHCYMFRTEPAHACMQHTGRKMTAPSQFGSPGMQALILMALLANPPRSPTLPSDT